MRIGIIVRTVITGVHLVIAGVAFSMFNTWLAAQKAIVTAQVLNDDSLEANTWANLVRNPGPVTLVGLLILAIALYLTWMPQINRIITDIIGVDNTND